MILSGAPYIHGFRHPTVQEEVVYATIVVIAFIWIYGRYWLRKRVARNRKNFKLGHYHPISP